MAADAGMYPASVIDIFAEAADPPTKCVNWINNIDVSLDGKNVDVTSFNCTTPPTFIQNKQVFKDLKITLKGFLDRADAGQASMWTEYLTPADTLYVKVGFGPTPTFFVMANVSVGNIGINMKADGIIEVTYELVARSDVTFA